MLLVMACQPEGTVTKSKVNHALDQSDRKTTDNQAPDQTNQASADTLAALMLADEVQQENEDAVAAMMPEDVKSAVDDFVAKIITRLDLDKDGKLSAEEIKSEFQVCSAKFMEHYKIHPLRK